uniref:Uncharacterized protein n=1 Tax=Arundo donax TaxID=35708 RepID=A0A0A9T9M3_ARUDO
MPVSLRWRTPLRQYGSLSSFSLPAAMSSCCCSVLPACSAALAKSTIAITGRKRASKVALVSQWYSS